MPVIQPNQDITSLVLPPARAAPPSMLDLALEEAALIGELLIEEEFTGTWCGEVSKTEAVSRLRRLAALYGPAVWISAQVP